MSFRSIFIHPGFALNWSGRLLTNLATRMQNVAVAWVVYNTTRLTHDQAYSAFMVGMMGLCQFVPMILLALLSGATADRYDRRKILIACSCLQIFCAACFFLLTLRAQPSLPLIFVVSAFYGISRTFSMPAGTALVPALVPRDILPSAIAYNTLAVQGAMVFGPAIGGALCAISPTLANITALMLYLVALCTGLMLLRLPIAAKPDHTGMPRLAMIQEGLVHLWNSKVVLGAISLDLFAVLLGGVTSLLSAFARDVLVDPDSVMSSSFKFGLLYSAFALGAGLMTFRLAAKPIVRHTGRWMLTGVTIYGIATLCFAFSRNVWLSMLCLSVAGIGDSISVFVRQNLVQILTPDTMRGRVSAVSSLFISGSNELGEFESGVAARLFGGVVGSAAFGGLGSVVITGLWAWMFPALRNADHLKPPELSNKAQ
jgi:MFS family permease